MGVEALGQCKNEDLVLNDDENYFLMEVKDGIVLCDAVKLAEAVSEFSEFCFKETPPVSDNVAFSDDFIDELMKLLGDPAYLEMDDSFKLLALFQDDWGRLSSSQQTKLLQFLETIFETLKDNTSHLVIAELFGEYLANDQSLQALNRLSHTKNEVARAHVVHGYKCLALNAVDQVLRDKAKARLLAMASDSSEVVQQEVAVAIADVSR